MIEADTIKLLRECDAGIQMGVAAIDDVLDYVTMKPFGNTWRIVRTSTIS